MSKKINKELSEGNSTEELLIEEKELIDDLMQKVDEPVNNKINGVAIGKLVSVDSHGKAFVDFTLNPANEPIAALSTISFNKEDIGKEVALLFKDNNPDYPVIIGPVILNKKDDETLLLDNSVEDKNEPIEILVDKKRITFNAEKEIVLKCGKSSITLTSAGKILIRGKYLLSRSSGVNRIKGGSVQIN